MFDIDDIGRRIEVQIPNFREQHLERNRLICILHKLFKEFKLLWCEGEMPPLPMRGAPFDMKFQIAMDQHRRR